MNKLSEKYADQFAPQKLIANDGSEIIVSDLEQKINWSALENKISMDTLTGNITYLQYKTCLSILILALNFTSHQKADKVLSSLTSKEERTERSRAFSRFALKTPSSQEVTTNMLNEIESKVHEKGLENYFLLNKKLLYKPLAKDKQKIVKTTRFEAFV